MDVNQLKKPSPHTGMTKVGGSWVHKDSAYYQNLLKHGLIKPHYRIPVSPRERTAYIKLRRFGYTINAIAKAFGRSTSIVHRTLTKAWMMLYRLKLKDMRKIPCYARQMHALYSPRTLRKHILAWEKWILSSDEAEPP